MKTNMEVEMSKAINDTDVFKEVVPDLLNIEGIASPYRLYRYDKGQDRYYFMRMEEGDAIKPVLSVTSFTQKVLNNAFVLMKWQDNVGGYDVANYIKNMRAEYGTLCHVIFGEIMKTGVYNFDEVKKRAWETAWNLGYKFEAEVWVEDIVEDMVAFMTFLIEREVEVIALEFPIADEDVGLGGTMDLICRLKFGKSRVNAIVDFKSGRKGFFEGHELQLGIYKYLWNRLYQGVFKVSHVFNFAPCGMMAKEKYKLKNQTDSMLVIGAENEVKLCKSRGILDGIKMTHNTIRGSGFWKDFKIEEHVKEVSI